MSFLQLLQASRLLAVKRSAESATERCTERERSEKRRKSRASDSEELARLFVESGRICSNTVLQVLQATEIPMSNARKNVLPDGVDAVQGMLLGFYALASNVGITCASKTNPWLTRLLSRFVQISYPDFEFTSIQLNKNYASRPHVDKNNLGDSLIIGLGDYTGGEIWVHDDSGDIPFQLNESISCMYHYEAGRTYAGKSMNLRGRWTTFNGNRLHFTKPFEGERFSLVYYTCSRYSDASLEMCCSLRAAGFPFSKSSKNLAALFAAKEEERRVCCEHWKQLQKDRFREAKEELGRCQARTWNKGWGGHCPHFVFAAGEEFCNMHVSGWKTHGRIHGSIPEMKKAEMIRAQRQMFRQGEKPPDPLPPGAMILV